MTQDVKGKVALVTGASRGIGRAIASRLAAEGALTVVNYLVDRAGAESTVTGIEREGGRAIAVRADVGSAREVSEMVETIRAAFGKPVQILVNNAGVIPNNTGWRTETADTLLAAYTTNVMGSLFCSQAVIEGMMDARWGRIINISSIYGEKSSPYVLSYSLSKAGMDAITRALAVDCGACGVTVNSVAPGNVDTEMTRRAGSDYVSQIEQRTPVKRLGTPREIAEAVLFLCGAAFLNGTELVADGGLRHT
ncbi:SDR family oxidoreductase [Thermopolyspora sp. NPDC052614]|uniref:SDR family NAD(P)-dependent oxidoreductase n=1 Tax=Thermopolyspora sp. NPDC052614 TaxID=3155682 RepID=UPI00342C2A3C